MYCFDFTEYTPVNKNKKFMRQKSKDEQSKVPSLRKEGAQKMSKKIAQAHARGDDTFMQPPDPGMSG